MERWLEQYASVALARSSDTAHDLKTPLNVAVLNLELLRMRIRKLEESGEDPKIAEYTRAIDGELRRMAMIFDAFFVHVMPPKGDSQPRPVDLGAMIAAEVSTFGIPVTHSVSEALVLAHEERMRELARLLCSGALRAMGQGLRFASRVDSRAYHAEFAGTVAEAAVEAVRLFKFYYTDPEGNAELSLATARLIAETYGGTLNGTGDGTTLSLNLTMPLGD